MKSSIVRLNAMQEFGRFAARCHAAGCVGGLDIANCRFNEDGTLAGVFSIGSGRLVDEALSAQERASDLASVRGTFDESEWEAFKRGYRLNGPHDVNDVLELTP